MRTQWVFPAKPEPSRGLIDHSYLRTALDFVTLQWAAPQQCGPERRFVTVAYEIDVDNFAWGWIARCAESAGRAGKRGDRHPGLFHKNDFAGIRSYRREGAARARMAVF